MVDQSGENDKGNNGQQLETVVADKDNESQEDEADFIVIEDTRPQTVKAEDFTPPVKKTNPEGTPQQPLVPSVLIEESVQPAGIPQAPPTKIINGPEPTAALPPNPPTSPLGGAVPVSAPTNPLTGVAPVGGPFAAPRPSPTQRPQQAAASMAPQSGGNPAWVNLMLGLFSGLILGLLLMKFTPLSSAFGLHRHDDYLKLVKEKNDELAVLTEKYNALVIMSDKQQDNADEQASSSEQDAAIKTDPQTP